MLNLNNNALSFIKTLPEGLQKLWARNNKIAFIGHVEDVAEHLEYLDLTNNRLISLEGISDLL